MAPRRQTPALPEIRIRPPGATTAGLTLKLGRARDDVREAVLLVGAPEALFLTTEIEAVPVRPPAVAVIVPLPMLVALNDVGLPGLGENVPNAGETDHVGVTETAFP